MHGICGMRLPFLIKAFFGILFRNMHKKNRRISILLVPFALSSVLLIGTSVYKKQSPITALYETAVSIRLSKESKKALDMGLALTEKGSHAAAEEVPKNEKTVETETVAVETEPDDSSDSTAEVESNASAKEVSVDPNTEGMTELQLLTDAAMHNNAEAQFSLGTISLAAKNDQGLIMAYVWYSLSAQQGHQEAADSLEEVRNMMTDEDRAQAQQRLTEAEAGIAQNVESPEVIAARDAKRKKDIQDIRNALLVYKFQHGAYPADLPANHSLSICSYRSSCENGVRLDALVDQGFLKAVPEDPKTSGPSTHYIIAGSNGEFSVIAPDTELTSPLTAGTAR